MLAYDPENGDISLSLKLSITSPQDTWVILWAILDASTTVRIIKMLLDGVLVSSYGANCGDEIQYLPFHGNNGQGMPLKTDYRKTSFYRLCPCRFGEMKCASDLPKTGDISIKNMNHLQAECRQ